MASFDEDTIYLGKNKRSSVINLCNGLATMRANTIGNIAEWFTITSDLIRLKGSDGTYAYSVRGDSEAALCLDAVDTSVSTAYDTSTYSSAVLRSEIGDMSAKIQLYAATESNPFVGLTLTDGSSYSHAVYLNPSYALIRASETRISGGNIMMLTTSGGLSGVDTAITWYTKNGHDPFFGYAKDQTDGTFVWSIDATNYASGLAIGGGSGNLLWKGTRVATVTDLASYLPTSGGTVSGNLTLYAASGNSPKLIFQRGDNTGTITDWNVDVVSGNLKFNTVSSSGSTTETNIVEIGYSGYMNVKGSIQENGTALSNKYAAKSQGIHYIVGTGTTEGTWLGSHSDITAYFDGLTIAYKVGIAGADTTTLNINSLGAKTVMRNASSKITTHYAVNSVVILVYTTDDGTGYWKIADYDANSYAYVRQYYTTTSANYPLLFKYDSGITTTTSYVTKYTRYGNTLYANPSTGTLYATTFSGTATKATADADGNTITSTYAKKNDAWLRDVTSTASSSGTYPGLMNPDGTTTGYVRVTQSGLLPYQNGGHGTVGTSSWPFNNGYFKNLYQNGTKVSVEGHSHGWTSVTVTTGTNTSGTNWDCAYNTSLDLGVIRGYVAYTPTAAVSAGELITIGTVPAAARPTERAAIAVYAHSTNARRWMGEIQAGGAIVLRSSGALTAGTEYGIYVNGVYRLSF